MSTALVPINDLERMATVVVKSQLFGVENLEQAMTLMLLAQAEGVHPAIAMRDYHIVEGKPALKADAMLARFQAGGGKIEWEEYTDAKVSAKFSHPQSPKPVLIEWDIERASKVKVYNRKSSGWEPITNKHTWKSYPRQMLKARVISEGVRATNPGVAVGIYTVEETQDFAQEKDITPKDPVAASVVNANVTPTAGARERLQNDQVEKVDKVVSAAVDWIANGSFEDAAAVIDEAAFDADESVYLWTQFDAKTRRLLKEANKARAMKAQAAARA